MMTCTNALVALFAVVTATVTGACDSTTTGSSNDGRDGSSAGDGGNPSTGGVSGSAGGSAGRLTGGTTGSAGEPGVDAGSGGQNNGGSGSTGGGSVDASVDTGTDGGGGVDAGNGGAATGGAATGGAAGSKADGGQDGDVDGGGGQRLREFGYIAARFGGLLTCSIQLENGAATQIGASFNLPRSSPVAIAVHPSQKFVYVVYQNFQDSLNFINTYAIASDGTLVTSGNLTVSVPDSVEGITVEPQGRFAYAVSGAGKAIYIYQVDSGTGELTPVGNPLLVGSPPDHVSPIFIAADPTGRFVYASPAFGNGIFGYRIERIGPPPGALTELAGSPFHIPELPDGGAAFGGAVAITPNGRFLYTSGGGRLSAFTINDNAGTKGALTPIDGSPFSLVVESDSQAPNLAISPLGEHLYATQFHSGASVHSFGINAVSGALAKLAEPFNSAAPYSIAIDPSGHFLYVLNDGVTMTGYSIASSGVLTELGPFQFGGLEAKMVFATLP